LNLDVPIGFRQSTSLKRDFNTFLPPCKVRPSIELPTADSSLSDSMVADISDTPPTLVTNSSSGVSVLTLQSTHLHELYQDTISLDAVLDKGDLSTIPKSACSTTPVICLSNFGDVIHMDIVFGPDISIGNIHNGLLFTDRYSNNIHLLTTGSYL
jgi:hypothetical protein